MIRRVVSDVFDMSTNIFETAKQFEPIVARIVKEMVALDDEVKWGMSPERIRAALDTLREKVARLQPALNGCEEEFKRMNIYLHQREETFVAEAQTRHEKEIK